MYKEVKIVSASKQSKKNEPLIDPVYEYLKEMILTLQIQEGEKLIESKISKQFGVSRTPVREALRRLSAEGLVRIFPNRAAEVVTFTKELVENMGVVRIALDVVAVKLAIYYGSNSDFMKLKQCLLDCEKAANQGDIFLQNKLDVNFHKEICRISQNEFILKYMSEIFLQLELLLNIRSKKGIRVNNDSNALHSEIVDALMNRNTEKATSLTKEHLKRFYKFDDSLATLFDE